MVNHILKVFQVTLAISEVFAWSGSSKVEWIPYIQDKKKFYLWHYVWSENNPADTVSRGFLQWRSVKILVGFRARIFEIRLNLIWKLVIGQKWSSPKKGKAIVLSAVNAEDKFLDEDIFKFEKLQKIVARSTPSKCFLNAGLDFNGPHWTDVWDQCPAKLGFVCLFVCL